ncbi:purine-nucleoside phosphorylase [Gluconobacter morbifer]|uniref:Purine nucleoside permease n=1 Tax=Gluconobacter morbifer G707 TaxID=1088869 RepID=G6XMQ1_9PROT|nr:purine nucleoside permease [Gluconobacter morbifer]EHH66950.1 hypothetical protein GMO_27690 [Gluconobacter morbifer G707]
MKRFILVSFCLASALALSASAFAQESPKEEIRVLVVANFEVGQDTGDEPGEFQEWVERLHLDETVPIQGVPDTLRRNRDGVYGIVLRNGDLDLHALALDPRFDLHHTYWLFTGISGVNPNIASVGSVAWARWVVDGDALREIDDRTVPGGWPYGLYAIGASRPDTLPDNPNHYGSVTDVAQLTKAYPLNQQLAAWAFRLSRSARLVDDRTIAERRRSWGGYPNARRAPFILMGETLGAERYWHGAPRNLWAENWVRLWTKGAGRFVMTNEESQRYQSDMRQLGRLGYIDPDRIMVLRSGSNFDMPPPGLAVTVSMGDEGPGQKIAYENNERAGEPVVQELVRHWDRYRDHLPQF